MGLGDICGADMETFDLERARLCFDHSVHVSHNEPLLEYGTSLGETDGNIWTLGMSGKCIVLDFKDLNIIFGVIWCTFSQNVRRNRP